MAKRPSEEDLGIAPTAEEVAALQQPAAVEDDMPITSEEDDVHQIVALKTATEEKPDGRKTRAHAPDGKFIAKDAKAEPEREEAPRTVDLRALQEERALRRQTEERMNVLLEVLNKREARAAKAEEPAAPQIPDKNVDPLAYIEYMEGRIGKIEGESKAQAEARQAAERQDAEFQQVLAVATPQFNEAMAADPTIQPTYNALLESFAKELCFVNRIPANSAQMTPQQKAFLGAELTKLEQTHIRYAVSTGQNVAEYMKALAATRNVTAPVAQQQPNAAPNVRAPRSIPDRQAAQQRHMSIGDLPGSAGGQAFSAKDLGKMSQKEFAAFAKKLGDDGLDELFQQA